MLLSFLVLFVTTANTYPVPIPPGGRMAVHGWLILPFLTDQDSNDTTIPVNAWFSHHTPEFWTTSPHDFQIILRGYLLPNSVAENETWPIGIPLPSTKGDNQLLVDEYSITPPPPFSLNDLLSGDITILKGVVYNGSFDTPYERIPLAIADLYIQELTTAVYLNDSADIPNYPTLQYLNYPRDPQGRQKSGRIDLYWAHQINSAPDFDEVVHVQVDLDNCKCKDCSAIDLVYKSGASWAVLNTTNTLDERLSANMNVGYTVQYLGSDALCAMRVIEKIHCVVGPDFGDVSC